MGIAIRNSTEIKQIAQANKIVARTLEEIKKHISTGVSLKELDKIAESFVLSCGAKPSFKGLYGFPSSICTSVNQVIIHGIPTDYKLKDGDIIGIDLGVEKNGWFGDAAFTIAVGNVSQSEQKLINCAIDTLNFSIDIIQQGMRFKELSFEIEKYILEYGYQPLRSYCGHGIGKKPHEEPEIPNYLDSKNPKQGPKIKNGMVFCIEPMICQQSGESKVLDDKWSVVSVDGLKGSHYEHTIAIVNNKAVVLSQE
ncbi:MAG: type I methionyl aminopeptidase [Campylobacterales bacterium]|nr:type I methionyl aminopeptidase [Campylobacterales bacterium]